MTKSGWAAAGAGGSYERADGSGGAARAAAGTFALLATTALVAASAPAAAQDATWLASPGSGDFDTAANWSPAAVPTGTAFFGTSNTTVLSFSSATTVGGWTFNAGASNYTFINGQTLNFSGQGVVINGGGATLANTGTVSFNASSAAGNATVANNLGGTLQFFDTTTAGSATITTNSGGLTRFFATSTGGDARFIANAGGSFNLSGLTAAGMTAGSIEGAGSTILGAKALTVGSNNLSTEVNGAISGLGGSLIKVGTGTLTLSGANTYTGGTTINGGTLQLGGATTGAILGAVTVGASGTFDVVNAATGIATIGNSGITNFRNDTSAGSATISNNLGGTLQFFNTSTAGSATITTNSGGLTRFFATSTGGDARFITNAGGSFDVSGLTAAGMTAGSIEGAGSTILGANALTVGSNNLSTEVSGAISGSGGLVKTGTGTLTLSGTSAYTGPTMVDGGGLVVNGLLVSSSQLTVNAGAFVGGTGILPATTINGGTLAPGNSIGTIAVQGNLSFGAGSVYRVEVSPTGSDRTNVIGTATLGGTVQAVALPGAVARNYTILSAARGLGGTTFQSLTTENLPSGFAASLSYTATDAMLNLTARLGAGTPLAGNHSNVANAINTAFNGGAALPASFVPVFNLSGPALGNALAQLSGEAAAGFHGASHKAKGQFLNTMLDRFAAGRGGGFGGAGAMAYAPEAQDAYAADLPVKAPPLAPTFEQRWSVWGSAFGGRNRLDGDAAAGSNDLSASIGGFAVGADYRVSPVLTLGAAVAIGETSWNVSGQGSGDSNLAQAGGYAIAQWDSFYLSGALAGSWHNVDRRRTIVAAGFDALTADFDATAIGGRVEGGWRHRLGAFGLTPYAAVQVQSVRTPAYSERGIGAFALNYASQTVTDTRTELGLWADTRHVVSPTAVVVLRGRAAWVHDFDPDSGINAAFQTLPGSSFTVNGAAAPRDAALLSAAGELRLANGLAFIAKADGEFSDRAVTYAGTGTVRYQW